MTRDRADRDPGSIKRTPENRTSLIIPVFSVAAIGIDLVMTHF